MPRPVEDPNGRYEVMFITGPPGFADRVTYRYKTLAEAYKRQLISHENNDPYFRWSKVTDLSTGNQLPDAE